MKIVSLYLSEYQCYLLRQVLDDYLINSRERLSYLNANKDCFDIPEVKHLTHFISVLNDVLPNMDKLLSDYEYSKKHELSVDKIISTLQKK